MEEGEKIAVEQPGFRMGYPTTDHIFTLIIFFFLSFFFLQNAYRKESGRFIYIPFTDYQKAFEKMNREYPCACLLANVLSKKMLFIGSVYESALCRLRLFHASLRQLWLYKLSRVLDRSETWLFALSKLVLSVHKWGRWIITKWWTRKLTTLIEENIFLIVRRWCGVVNCKFNWLLNSSCK